VPLLGRSVRRMTSSASSPLLDGYKVVELASVLAGPSVCQFLAEHGATVIKVENMTTAGDVTRTWRLPADRPGEDVTAYFTSCNLGKRSVALNMKDPRGRDAVHRLAASADVVVASYKPGDAQKLQVDYDTLSARNPSLVYAQLTGYGLDDHRPGYDAVIQAEAGFQFMNGAPDSAPTKMPVALMDLLAAHQLKEALLAALWKREREGGTRGAFVEVSLLGAGVASLANQATGYLRRGVVPQRMGSDHPSIVPYGTVFGCSDGASLTLAVGSDKQFRALCDVLGDASLAADERFATNPARVANREACKERIAELVSRRDRAEILIKLRQRAVPAGGVNDMEAVFEQPAAQALVVRAPNGQPMGIRQIAYNVVAGGARQPELRAPPGYGEHTLAVLTEDAGLSAAEAQTLVEDGIAAQRPETCS